MRVCEARRHGKSAATSARVRFQEPSRRRSRRCFRGVERVVRRGRADGGTSADKTACADVYVPPARSRAMQLALIPLEASGTGGLDLGRDVI